MLDSMLLTIYYPIMKFEIAKTKKDIKTCHKLREIIFIKEQNVPVFVEKDSKDDFAIHFLLLDDNDIPVGVGRVVADNNTAVVGRVGIMKEFRKKRLGFLLMQNIIDYCKNQGFEKITLSAQEHALDFYKKLNFEVISDRYISPSNIPHFKMKLDVSKPIYDTEFH